MSAFQKITLVITILGAANYGLTGLFRLDAVAFVFGDMTYATRIIYILIGFSGVLNIAILPLRRRKMNNGKK